VSKYKDLIQEAQIDLGNDEVAKAEKILIKETNAEELRFSWWKVSGNKFIPRPLDLPEEQWVELFEAAVENNVVSQEFIKKMIKVLAEGLK